MIGNGRGALGDDVDFHTGCQTDVVEIGQGHQGHDLTDADITVGRVGAGMERAQGRSDLVGLAVEVNAIGNRQLNAMGNGCLAGAEPQVLTEGVAFVRHDHANVFAPLCNQSLHGHASENLVVEVDVRVGRGEVRPAMGGKGEVVLQQVADPLVKALGAGKDNGICQRVPADVADCLKPVVGKTVCCNGDRVAGSGKAFGHAAEKLGCEAEKLVPCVQEKADNLGAAGAQALCRAIGNVAETAGNFGNAFARRLRDPGVSGKGAGNRGHREACLLRHRAQGGTRQLFGGATAVGFKGFSRHARSLQPKPSSSKSKPSLIRAFVTLQHNNVLQCSTETSALIVCKTNETLCFSGVMKIVDTTPVCNVTINVA